MNEYHKTDHHVRDSHLHRSAGPIHAGYIDARFGILRAPLEFNLADSLGRNINTFGKLTALFEVSAALSAPPTNSRIYKMHRREKARGGGLGSSETGVACCRDICARLMRRYCRTSDVKRDCFRSLTAAHRSGGRTRNVFRMTTMTQASGVHRVAASAPASQYCSNQFVLLM